MKSTGIVRKVDQLNRIVIPRETCRTYGIEEGTPLQIFTEGETIVLKKYEPGCTFCGDMKNLELFKGKYVCKQCCKDLKI